MIYGLDNQTLLYIGKSPLSSMKEYPDEPNNHGARAVQISACQHSTAETRRGGFDRCMQGSNEEDMAVHSCWWSARNAPHNVTSRL